MAHNQRDQAPPEGSEPVGAADTDKIDQAEEPAVHPDTPGENRRDKVAEALERAEGNTW